MVILSSFHSSSVTISHRMRSEMAAVRLESSDWSSSRDNLRFLRKTVSLRQWWEKSPRMLSKSRRVAPGRSRLLFFSSSSSFLRLSVGPGYQLVCFWIREYASDPSQKPALDLQSQSAGSRWRLRSAWRRLFKIRDPSCDCRGCVFHSPFIIAETSRDCVGKRARNSHDPMRPIGVTWCRRAPPSWSPHHFTRVPLTGSPRLDQSLRIPAGVRQPFHSPRDARKASNGDTFLSWLALSNGEPWCAVWLTHMTNNWTVLTSLRLLPSTCRCRESLTEVPSNRGIAGNLMVLASWYKNAMRNLTRKREIKMRRYKKIFVDPAANSQIAESREDIELE